MLIDKIIQHNKDFSKSEDYSIGICSNDTRILKKIGDSYTRSTLSQKVEGRKSGIYWEESILLVKRAVSDTQQFNISYDYNDINGYIYIMHIDPPK